VSHGIVRKRSPVGLLLFLLLVDFIFITIHVALWYRGYLPDAFNVEADGQLPEMFNNLKWLASCLGCLWLYDQHKEPVYAAWAALFVYFLVDDAFSLHEHVGAWLSSALSLRPHLNLRAVDFGELIVFVTAGAVLFACIAVAYSRTTNTTAKRLARRLAIATITFGAFAVVVDMLHIALAGSPTTTAMFGVLEDGGEMVVASVMTFIVWQHAVS
jgi:hypothetical protein